MCIVAIAWQLFDDLPLVLLSNRDEFLDRPTKQAYQWPDLPIYAGRDKKSGGTWLGIHQTMDGEQNGRWAAVLNFRDGVQASDDQRSRGELVTDYLASEMSPIQYARQLELQAYAGFNLIVGDAQQAVLVNNRGYPPTPLFAGLHVLSNGQPDSEWFKCERLRGRVRQEVLPLIAEASSPEYWLNSAYEVLSDRQKAAESQLPETGMPAAIEHALSSVFIESGQRDLLTHQSNTTDTPPVALVNYGTRTQSILTLSGSRFDIRATLTSRSLSSAT